MPWEYALALSALFVGTLVAKQYFKVRLYKNTKQAVFLATFFLVVGVVYDSFAIWRGHYLFPGPGIFGIFIGNVPIEDFFYLLIVPFWILVTYKVFTEKFNLK